jgi:hypothetical protein
MTATFELENEDGDEVEFERAFKWEVCDVCRGRGTHVNPSIDADHGITAEEFADDPQFKEDYFGGVYDQTCNQCRGKRVVPELRDPCPELDDYQRRIYEDRAEREAEMRMGY